MSKPKDEREPEETEDLPTEEDFWFEYGHDPGVHLPPGFDMYESYGGMWFDPDDFRAGDEVEISLDHATDEEWQELLDKIKNK